MGGTPDHVSQREFEKAVEDGAVMLRGLIARLDERREEVTQEAGGRARAALEGLDLHPRIAAVSRDLYRGRHYRNAVLDGYLALENYVKEKSRCHERAGADLMRYVFSKKTPVLAFNQVSDDSERDEQEGLMHLFEGAALALHNPRAHSLVNDTPEDALEYLGLLTLLANRVDKASRHREP